MAISSDDRVDGPYNGNDVTTVFPFTFKVFTSADLRVILTDTDGVETVLTLTTHYTVSLNSDQDISPGGSVTMLTAPATGEKLTITSDIAALQSVVLQNGGGFYPAVLNNAHDKLTILIQQLSERLDRCISIPISDGVGLTLQATSIANRAGKYLYWDASGNLSASVAVTPVSGSTTDNTVPRFDGTAGALQTSLVSISDAGSITTPGGGLFGSDAQVAPGVVLLGSDGGYLQLKYGSNFGVRTRATANGTGSLQAYDGSNWQTALTWDSTKKTSLAGDLAVNTNKFNVTAADGSVGIGTPRVLLYDTNAGADVSSFYQLMLGGAASNTTRLLAGENNGQSYIGGATANNAGTPKYVTDGLIVFKNSANTAGSETGYVEIRAKPSGASAYDTAVARFEGDIITLYKKTAVKGTDTNDDKSAGYVGEIKYSTVGFGSAVALTTGTGANVTSISLEAGDWTVFGCVAFLTGATTTQTLLEGSISTTSATIGQPDIGTNRSRFDGTIATGSDNNLVLQPVRLSLSGTTTVYLVAKSTFAVSTNAAFGTIWARRA